MWELELEMAGCDGGVEGRNGHLVDRLVAYIAKIARWKACSGEEDARRRRKKRICELWRRRVVKEAYGGRREDEIRNSQSSKGNDKKPWRWKTVYGQGICATAACLAMGKRRRRVGSRSGAIWPGCVMRCAMGGFLEGGSSRMNSGQQAGLVVDSGLWALGSYKPWGVSGREVGAGSGCSRGMGVGDGGGAWGVSRPLVRLGADE